MDHVLLHIITRYKDDGVTLSWQGKSTKLEELQALHQQLAPKLSLLTLPKQKVQASPIAQPSEEFIEDDAEPFADF